MVPHNFNYEGDIDTSGYLDVKKVTFIYSAKLITNWSSGIAELMKQTLFG